MSWLTEICGAFGGAIRRLPEVVTHDGDGSDERPFEERTISGPHDEVESGLLYRRSQMVSELRRTFRDWGHCERCGWPWSVVRGHTTWHEPHRAVFCLCHDCWEELQVPEYRLPYYRMLWERSFAGRSDVTWEQVEAAVYAEREVLDRRIQTEINIGWPVPREGQDAH